MPAARLQAVRDAELASWNVAPYSQTQPVRGAIASPVNACSVHSTAINNVTLYMYIGKRHSPCGITAHQEFDSGALLYGNNSRVLLYAGGGLIRRRRRRRSRSVFPDPRDTVTCGVHARHTTTRRGGSIRWRRRPRKTRSSLSVIGVGVQW